MNNPSEKKIWFPAKRYGWGWGAPCCWQGWVVLGVYIILLTAAALIIPKYGLPFFYGYTFVLSLILIAICWRKGEKPRWRWGKKS